MLLVFPEAGLVHLAPEVQAVGLGLVALGLHQHAFKHAVLEIAKALLVVGSLLVLPAFQLLHLLPDRFLVLAQRRPPLQVVVPIIPAQQPVVHVGEGLDF